MSTEITIVYSDEAQLKNVRDFIKESLTFTFLDTTTSKGKKKGWALKSHWGAKLDPFVVITEDKIPKKVFYSEDKINPIDSLIKWLKEQY